MSTLATLVYSVVAQGATPSAITAALAAVPLPQDILTRLGVRVQGDVTAALTRTIALRLVPIVDATATAQILPGNDGSGSPVVGLTSVGEGNGYAAPPDVVITDSVGKGFGAKANAKLNILSVALTGGGAGYVSPPTVNIVGGDLRGTPAVITATVALGAVTALNLVSSGSGYNGIPTLVITGGGGAGATGTVLMQAAGLTLLGGGKGYVAPVVTLKSHFKTMFPDTGDQRAPFWNLMRQSIQRQLCCPIFAAAPVIT